MSLLPCTVPQLGVSFWKRSELQTMLSGSCTTKGISVVKEAECICPVYRWSNNKQHHFVACDLKWVLTAMWPINQGGSYWICQYHEHSTSDLQSPSQSNGVMVCSTCVQFLQIAKVQWWQQILQLQSNCGDTVPAVLLEPPLVCCCLICPSTACAEGPVLMCWFPDWWRLGLQSGSLPRSSSATDHAV